MSRGRIRIFTFRCPEVGLEFSLLGARDVPNEFHRTEERSRRSSCYKGGVTRGREEQPQGNRSRWKRGSPITKKAGSKSNTGAREIEFNKACQKVGKIDDKNEDLF